VQPPPLSPASTPERVRNCLVDVPDEDIDSYGQDIDYDEGENSKAYLAALEGTATGSEGVPFYVGM
jgi:hypothetical protein